MKAIVLLSGGLDSTTALYTALRSNCPACGTIDTKPVCLTVHYGQLHEREIESAKKIASYLKLEHWIIPLSLPWGGSALTDPEIAVPKNRGEVAGPLEARQPIPCFPSEIPVTYVPARNSIFLSLAASLAEVKEAEAIYFGANALDYSGYPDCRPEFIEAFEEMIREGTRAGSEGRKIRVVAPLLRMTKAEIVRLGKELGVPFEWTWSCYEGKDTPCGECDSCILRAKGFREAGIDDPLFSRVIARSPCLPAKQAARATKQSRNRDCFDVSEDAVSQ